LHIFGARSGISHLLHAPSAKPSETAISKVQNLRMPTPQPARIMTKFCDNFRVAPLEFRFSRLLRCYHAFR